MSPSEYTTSNVGRSPTSAVMSAWITSPEIPSSPKFSTVFAHPVSEKSMHVTR